MSNVFGLITVHIFLMEDNTFVIQIKDNFTCFVKSTNE